MRHTLVLVSLSLLLTACANKGAYVAPKVE